MALDEITKNASASTMELAERAGSGIAIQGYVGYEKPKRDLPSA
jgi:hypothetical protein